MDFYPDKILIIRLSSLGDIVLSYPLIHQLHRTFPRARIHFLVRPEYRELLENHPFVDRVITLNPSDGLPGLLQLRKDIREQNYPVILDIHRNLRTFVLLAGSRFPLPLVRWLTGKPQIRVYRIRKQQFARFLLVHFKINLYRQWYGRTLSVREKYLKTAQPLGVPQSPEVFEFPYPLQYRTRARNILHSNGIDPPFVVMAPGSRHFTKRWPAEYFAQLADLLYRNFQLKTVLVGGPEDQPVAREVLKHSREKSIVSLTGELPLLFTVGVIHLSTAMVTNDSGLMHIADALQIPTLAIFGSTVKELGFFPLSSHSVVLENQSLSCRPCSHIGRETCPKGHFRCMRELTPDMAWTKLLPLLKSSVK